MASVYENLYKKLDAEAEEYYWETIEQFDDEYDKGCGECFECFDDCPYKK